MARTHEIPREEWKDFLRFFSRRHNSWLITLEDGIVSMRHQPLNELRLDDGQIVLRAGDHIVVIPNPTSLSLVSTEEGADEALEIVTASGKTLIIIDSPVLPEMVDGIP